MDSRLVGRVYWPHPWFIYLVTISDIRQLSSINDVSKSVLKNVIIKIKGAQTIPRKLSDIKDHLNRQVVHLGDEPSWGRGASRVCKFFLHWFHTHPPPNPLPSSIFRACQRPWEVNYLVHDLFIYLTLTAFPAFLSIPSQHARKWAES